jgi:hypothetical protein
MGRCHSADLNFGLVLITKAHNHFPEMHRENESIYLNEVKKEPLVRTTTLDHLFNQHKEMHQEM